VCLGKESVPREGLTVGVGAQVLDDALTRPGRFDRVVTIDAPDLKGRAQVRSLAGRDSDFSNSCCLYAAARLLPWCAEAAAAMVYQWSDAA
jgi:cell division protease FtsH